MDKLEKLLAYYIREELYEKAAEIAALIVEQNALAKTTESYELKN